MEADRALQGVGSQGSGCQERDLVSLRGCECMASRVIGELGGQTVATTGRPSLQGSLPWVFSLCTSSPVVFMPLAHSSVPGERKCSCPMPHSEGRKAQASESDQPIQDPVPVLINGVILVSQPCSDLYFTIKWRKCQAHKIILKIRQKIHQRISKCSTWASNFSITWEFVRNATSWALPWTC